MGISDKYPSQPLNSYESAIWSRTTDRDGEWTKRKNCRTTVNGKLLCDVPKEKTKKQRKEDCLDKMLSKIIDCKCLAPITFPLEIIGGIINGDYLKTAYNYLYKKK